MIMSWLIFHEYENGSPGFNHSMTFPAGVDHLASPGAFAMHHPNLQNLSEEKRDSTCATWQGNR